MYPYCGSVILNHSSSILFCAVERSLNIRQTVIKVSARRRNTGHLEWKAGKTAALGMTTIQSVCF